MSAKPAKVALCDECRFDGGWHYPEDGQPTRPHHDQAKLLAEAHNLSAAANEAAMQAGRLIIRDVAATRHEFNANDIRHLFDDADIPDPVIGAVFRWAASDGATAGGPLIENTKRRVQSSEKSTRHEITVWRSLVCRRAVAS